MPNKQKQDAVNPIETEGVTKKVVITGDLAIDHLLLPESPKDSGQNWQLYNSLKTMLSPGGAFLLTDFVKEIVKYKNIRTEIVSPKRPEQLNNNVARDMVQAKVFLKIFKEGEKPNEKKIIRVGKYFGYSCESEKDISVPDLDGRDEDAQLLIIDDAGNGFRNMAGAFPKCIENPDTLVIYKMSRPLVQGELWQKIASRKENWIVVINAKDIRNCSNVHVSKSLSWERTACEMIYQIEHSDTLSELSKAPYLIILFGTDGALLYQREREIKPQLIFDPEFIEGGFTSTIEGFSLGTNSLFTAILCANILEKGTENIIDGIKEGLSAMRGLIKNGFIIEDNLFSYPLKTILASQQSQKSEPSQQSQGSQPSKPSKQSKPFNYTQSSIERFHNLNEADPNFYRIVDQKTQDSNILTTIGIVKNKKPSIFSEIPIGKFGGLETIDRREIEQFNAIKILIKEFLDDPKPERPLCFAVFGAPGAGKSFGLKQVLKSLKRKDLETMTFNISQYASYDDLVADFHRIRDKVLTGIIPVAFFDEFDCNLDNKPLGWLKYFLSPMQDGEFKERETVHPIGKSIFVFAGGTRSSFENFIMNKPDNDEENNIESKIKSNQNESSKQFADAKGPDFVSRLRGYINIMGPNPVVISGKPDEAYMIRRAKILRSIFEFTAKTKQLFNSHDELQIDGSVLRALLNIPKYKHGNRSMSAIIDMSRIADKRNFDLSALPTPDQLKIHVDANLFMWLAARERFYTLLPIKERFEIEEKSPIDWENKIIGKIAEGIHLDYYEEQKKLTHQTVNAKPWSELSEDKKKSNIDAAEDIPNKLMSCKIGVRKMKTDSEAHAVQLSKEEILILAKTEHKRWCREVQIQGWKYGEKRDDEKKINPLIVDWDKLPEEEKRKDFQQIEAIPRILKFVGYELYRIG